MSATPYGPVFIAPPDAQAPSDDGVGPPPGLSRSARRKWWADHDANMTNAAPHEGAPS